MMDEIEPCIVHTHTDPDCEFCARQLAEMQAAYDAQIQVNIGLEKELMRDNARMDPTSIIALKMDMFIGALLQDPKAKLAFDVAFLAVYGEKLAEGKKEIMMAKLMGQR